MRKMIIAAISAIAVIASVIGCQVYDPTDNSTAYSGMRTQGATSWEAYIDAFNDADAEGKDEYIQEYKSTLRATYMKKHGDKIVVKYKSTIGDETGDFSVFETNYTKDWLTSYNALVNKYAEKKAIVDTKGLYATDAEKQAATDAKDSIKRYSETLLRNLWDEKYDVLWDNNNKL